MTQAILGSVEQKKRAASSQEGHVVIPKFASRLEIAQMSPLEAIAGQAVYMKIGKSEERLAGMWGGYGAHMYHQQIIGLNGLKM